MKELNINDIKDPSVSRLFQQINSQNKVTEEYLKIKEGVYFPNIKSGATQSAAGAVAGELWKTSSHATLPDNVLMIGV